MDGKIGLNPSCLSSQDTAGGQRVLPFGPVSLVVSGVRKTEDQFPFSSSPPLRNRVVTICDDNYGHDRVNAQVTRYIDAYNKAKSNEEKRRVVAEFNEFVTVQSQCSTNADHEKNQSLHAANIILFNYAREVRMERVARTALDSTRRGITRKKMPASAQKSAPTLGPTEQEQEINQKFTAAMRRVNTKDFSAAYTIFNLYCDANATARVKTHISQELDKAIAALAQGDGKVGDNVKNQENFCLLCHVSSLMLSRNIFDEDGQPLQAEDQEKCIERCKQGISKGLDTTGASHYMAAKLSGACDEVRKVDISAHPAEPLDRGRQCLIIAAKAGHPGALYYTGNLERTHEQYPCYHYGHILGRRDELKNADMLEAVDALDQYAGKTTDGSTAGKSFSTSLQDQTVREVVEQAANALDDSLQNPDLDRATKLTLMQKLRKTIRNFFRFKWLGFYSAKYPANTKDAHHAKDNLITAAGDGSRQAAARLAGRKAYPKNIPAKKGKIKAKPTEELIFATELSGAALNNLCDKGRRSCISDADGMVEFAISVYDAYEEIANLFPKGTVSKDPDARKAVVAKIKHQIMLSDWDLSDKVSDLFGSQEWLSLSNDLQELYLTNTRCGKQQKNKLNRLNCILAETLPDTTGAPAMPTAGRKVAEILSGAVHATLVKNGFIKIQGKDRSDFVAEMICEKPLLKISEHQAQSIVKDAEKQVQGSGNSSSDNMLAAVFTNLGFSVPVINNTNISYIANIAEKTPPPPEEAKVLSQSPNEHWDQAAGIVTFMHGGELWHIGGDGSENKAQDPLIGNELLPLDTDEDNSNFAYTRGQGLSVNLKENTATTLGFRPDHQKAYDIKNAMGDKQTLVFKFAESSKIPDGGITVKIKPVDEGADEAQEFTVQKKTGEDLVYEVIVASTFEFNNGFDLEFPAMQAPAGQCLQITDIQCHLGEQTANCALAETPELELAEPELEPEPKLVPAGKEHYDNAGGGIFTFIHDGVVLAKDAKTHKDVLQANPLFSVNCPESVLFSYKSGEGLTLSELKHQNMARLTFKPDARNCPDIVDEGVLPAFVINFGAETKLPKNSSVSVLLIPKNADSSQNRLKSPSAITIKPPLSDRNRLGRRIRLNEFGSKNLKNGFDMEITFTQNLDQPANPGEVFKLSITDVYFELDPTKAKEPPVESYTLGEGRKSQREQTAFKDKQAHTLETYDLDFRIPDLTTGETKDQVRVLFRNSAKLAFGDDYAKVEFRGTQGDNYCTVRSYLYGVFAFLTKEESNGTQFVRSLAAYNDEHRLEELYKQYADHLQKWDFCALTQDEKSIKGKERLMYSYIEPYQPGSDHKEYFVRNMKFLLELCQDVVNLVNQGRDSEERDDIYTKILTGNYDQNGRAIQGVDGRVYDLAICEAAKLLLGVAYLEGTNEERMLAYECQEIDWYGHIGRIGKETGVEAVDYKMLRRALGVRTVVVTSHEANSEAHITHSSLANPDENNEILDFPIIALSYTSDRHMNAIVRPKNWEHRLAELNINSPPTGPVNGDAGKMISTGPPQNKEDTLPPLGSGTLVPEQSVPGIEQGLSNSSSDDLQYTLTDVGDLSNLRHEEITSLLQGSNVLTVVGTGQASTRYRNKIADLRSALPDFSDINNFNAKLTEYDSRMQELGKHILQAAKRGQIPREHALELFRTDENKVTAVTKEMQTMLFLLVAAEDSQNVNSYQKLPGIIVDARFASVIQATLSEEEQKWEAIWGEVIVACNVDSDVYPQHIQKPSQTGTTTIAPAKMSHQVMTAESAPFLRGSQAAPNIKILGADQLRDVVCNECGAEGAIRKFGDAFTNAGKFTSRLGFQKGENGRYAEERIRRALYKKQDQPTECLKHLVRWERKLVNYINSGKVEEKHISLLTSNGVLSNKTIALLSILSAEESKYVLSKFDQNRKLDQFVSDRYDFYEGEMIQASANPDPNAGLWGVVRDALSVVADKDSVDVFKECLDRPSNTLPIQSPYNALPHSLNTCFLECSLQCMFAMQDVCTALSAQRPLSVTEGNVTALKEIDTALDSQKADLTIQVFNALKSIYRTYIQPESTLNEDAETLNKNNLHSLQSLCERMLGREKAAMGDQADVNEVSSMLMRALANCVLLVDPDSISGIVTQRIEKAYAFDQIMIQEMDNKNLEAVHVLDTVPLDECDDDEARHHAESFGKAMAKHFSLDRFGSARKDLISASWQEGVPGAFLFNFNRVVREGADISDVRSTQENTLPCNIPFEFDYKNYAPKSQDIVHMSNIIYSENINNSLMEGALKSAQQVSNIGEHMRYELESFVVHRAEHYKFYRKRDDGWYAQDLGHKPKKVELDEVEDMQLFLEKGATHLVYSANKDDLKIYNDNVERAAMYPRQ